MGVVRRTVKLDVELEMWNVDVAAAYAISNDFSEPDLMPILLNLFD